MPPVIFSQKYPPKNRPSNNLGPIDIEIEHSQGIAKLTPNDAIIAFLEGGPSLGDPVKPSVLSGQPGFIYRTSDIEVALTYDEISRLQRRALKPGEFFKLAKEYGCFFEIHDDFYDEETGEMLQPNLTSEEELELENPLVVFPSDSGFVFRTHYHQLEVPREVLPNELTEILDEAVGATPMATPSETSVKVITSTDGDWVRVELDNRILYDNHSLSPSGLVDILTSLGVDVAREERKAGDF